MFDHVSIGVSDIKNSGMFYDAVLKNMPEFLMSLTPMETWSNMPSSCITS